ncbi:hypothetical protein LOAG_18736 [Loa loa]|uniref:Uncharacterized protein n=1 Tax=Loa loa TaxID=7209 RepID=A0A1S0UGB2_LOALO|nr:hypothetical protein LOAG_18736 [Loa loa]EJD73874.1 hypothetical protein LOAG_18736 [Loa loa]
MPIFNCNTCTGIPGKSMNSKILLGQAFSLLCSYSFIESKMKGQEYTIAMIVIVIMQFCCMSSADSLVHI